MKFLYIILDGIGDDVIKKLGNKTPLEAANTPVLDKLAEKSKLGLLQLFDEKIAPESDEAFLALLGFDPLKYHEGRGPLEAFGTELKFKKGNVVLRCNFAKIAKNRIFDTEYIPTKNEIKKIENIKIKNIRFKHTIEHRGALILSGNVSANISNTNPTYKIVVGKLTTALPKNKNLFVQKCKPLDKTKAAKFSADLVNKFVTESKKILKNKIIITRGAGSVLPKIKLENKWALLADSPVEKAIGKLAGMKTFEKEKNYKKLVNQIVKLLKKFDNLCVQIKILDSLSHKGDPHKKTNQIEKLDRALFKQILNSKLIKETIICITADHSTSSKLKAHTSDPVPVLIFNPKTSPDFIKKFAEKYCRYGSLGLLNGTELFKLLVNQLN